MLKGPVETLTVDVQGLPANTEFDFFVIQVPNAPFGLSWYPGDIETGARTAVVTASCRALQHRDVHRRSGEREPPDVHHLAPFPDATSNPATAPVHTFHLGLWFNSAEDAVQAGCPGNITPFNGDHHAGIQVLSTRQFGNGTGPLRMLGS